MGLITDRAMNAAKTDTMEALERNLAFADGLSTESPTKVSSAAYVYSELDGFPKLNNDFEYKRGYGISSETVQLNLAYYHDEIKKRKFEAKSGDREVGELFNKFEDKLVDLALYLYYKNNPERESTNSWEEEVDRLEDQSDELEDILNELKQEIEH